MFHLHSSDINILNTKLFLIIFHALERMSRGRISSSWARELDVFLAGSIDGNHFSSRERDAERTEEI